MDYYNTCEEGEWTEETVSKRISQVLTREDSMCLVAELEGKLAAFAFGYMEQYDDGFAYDLVEIVVDRRLQSRGIGSAFMAEIERCAKERGAFLIQLQAVADDAHERFYGRLGYKNALNFVLKCKMLNLNRSMTFSGHAPVFLSAIYFACPSR